ncbi:hypothetical protein, partial [Acaryochloris sp. IP29b_bin.137]|uniref:hypothetical protein n=1 Tax=Acaryochloris sp. IP29b_bin.137 TaxID=2969217 RepID=UPI00260B01A8
AYAKQVISSKIFGMRWIMPSEKCPNPIFDCYSKRINVRVFTQRVIYISGMTGYLVLHEVTKAHAQFFAEGESYANQVFPDAQPVNFLIIGAIRLFFIYNVGVRGIRIVTGFRKEEQVGDLVFEVVIFLAAIVVIDLLLARLVP